MIHQHRGIFTRKFSDRIDQMCQEPGYKEGEEDKDRDTAGAKNKHKQVNQKTLNTAGYSNVAFNKTKEKRQPQSKLEKLSVFGAKGGIKGPGH